MGDIEYITIKQIIFLNKAMIERYNIKKEEPKIVDRSSLESAIARPQQSAFGEDAYKTLEEKAVALYESLTNNHPFMDGNKRTAFAGMYLFLYINGFKLTATKEEVTQTTLDLANDKISFEEIVEWIKNNIEKTD